MKILKTTLHSRILDVVDVPDHGTLRIQINYVGQSTCHNAIPLDRHVVPEIIDRFNRFEPAEPGGPKPYSVLLLYPDYSTDSFGTNTHWANVYAEGPAAAVRAARDCCDKEGKREGDDRLGEDLHPLAVIEGHHVLQNPASETP